MPAPLDPWSSPRPSPQSAPRLILGAMNFGKRTPESEARRIVDRAWELGIRHFDTANAYTGGESERILARALKNRREAAVITTKVGLSRVGGAPSGLIQTGGQSEGLSRARVLAACDESLARLETDTIDIYYLHVPDPATPIEETLSAFADLLRMGKIRAFGVSNYASWQILEMMAWCDREGVPRPIMAQQLYNLLVRQLELEYFAFAQKYRLHTAVYNPLAGGLLTSSPLPEVPREGSRFDQNPMYQNRYYSARLRAETADYRAIANELGMSVTALAYAFLCSRPGVDSILVGPGTLAHLEDAIAGCATRLDDATIERLDAQYRSHQGTDARYARI